MYLMRYSGDTGSGIQVESHLFLSQDAARAFMKADFETEREAYAKNGAALPNTTSEEDEEYYTDISEDEILVYQDGDIMLWEVVEIMPKDMPASLTQAPEADNLFPVDIYSAFAGNELSTTIHDPHLLTDEDEVNELLAEALDLDYPNGMKTGQSSLWLPDTLVNRIQVEGIRRFLAGTFSIEPIGYAIADCNGIGLEIEMISDDGVFEDDEEAVQQAIQDGVKLIPVEELPEDFDRRYLGWIDTPENRQRIQEYCAKRKN